MSAGARARPRVLVLGTGAMATAFGAYLARDETTEVTLAGTWTAALDALTREGARVEDRAGAWTARPRAVPLDAAGPEADFVLVLVKSTRTGALEFGRAVKRVAGAGALVVTLQNGLGNREALERAAGIGHVALGVATFGATLLGPGHVRAFPGNVVLALDAPPDEARLLALAGLLSRAGLPAATSADVRPVVWSKLAVNCAINPLTALTGLTNGALLEHPRLRTLLSRAAREVAEVAEAMGIHQDGDAAERALAVAEATGPNRSSMLQDLERGVPTEIEFLNGALVAEAAARQVPVPVNEWLWRSVRAREAALKVRNRRPA